MRKGAGPKVPVNAAASWVYQGPFALRRHSTSSVPSTITPQPQPPIDNMKVLLVLSSLAALAVAFPQAPEGRPSGRLLLLPARLEQEPAQVTSNATQESDESQSRVLTKGEYYVLLEGGRLQMVKYTTATLPAEGDGDAEEDEGENQATQEPGQAQLGQFTQQRYPVYYVQAENGQPQEAVPAQSAKYSNPAQSEEYPKYYAQFPQAAQYTQDKEASTAQSAKYSKPAQSEEYPKYYAQFPQAAQYTQDKEASTAQSAKYSKPAQPEPYPFYYVQAEGAPEEASPAKYSAPAQPQPQYPVYYVQAEATQPAQPAQKTAKYSQPQSAVPAGDLQIEYVQFPLPGSQFTQTKLQLVQAPEDKADQETDAEQASGFEANLQYRDVKPISAPIYAYNSAPLVRILKK